MKINLEAVTVQDCIDMDELKGRGSLLDDGRVSGFVDDHGVEEHWPGWECDQE